MTGAGTTHAWLQATCGDRMLAFDPTKNMMGRGN